MTWILTRTATVDATADRVFRLITDSAQATAWVEHLRDVRHVRGEGPGKTWDWSFELGGLPMRGHMRTTLWQPGVRVRSESTGDVRSTWDWRLAPAVGGVEVQLKVQVIPPVSAVRALGTQGVQAACDAVVDGVIDRLRALAESGYELV
ncbi:MAG: SRPBCC family protein [Alphaproteobacteria bacterium]|nr:SRPBCC family protein [Alphaproteobacteria bacterium]